MAKYYYGDIIKGDVVKKALGRYLNEYRIPSRKPKEIRSLWRLRHSWKDDIKMDLKILVIGHRELHWLRMVLSKNQ
jgi:hypothetical protein